MRRYFFITIGLVLDELMEESSTKKKLSRGTYHRLEKELNLPLGRKNSSGWQIFTEKQKDLIKKKIKKYYHMY